MDANEAHVPPNTKFSSDSEGEETVMVDKDEEVSPSIPPAEFHDANHPIGMASVEEYNGCLRLKQRSPFSSSGRIIYCLMPNFPKMSVNPCYGPTSIHEQGFDGVLGFLGSM